MKNPDVFEGIDSLNMDEYRVLYVDDSSVARDQIVRTLDHMGLSHIEARNGVQAWEKLNELGR